jgi:chromosome segregation ATPase
MAALPTCSVRALPEHHQLLRRIGRALATQPNLVAPLTDLIEGVTQDVTTVTRSNTDVTQDTTAVDRPSTAVDQRIDDIERRHEELQNLVVQEILEERLGRQEKTTLKFTKMVETINDHVKNLEKTIENINGRVKDLEKPVDPQAVTQQHDTATRGKRRSKPT